MKVFSTRRGLVYVVSLVSYWLAILATIHTPPPAHAAIYRWDTGELISDRDAVPNADLAGLDLSYADLAETDLTNADLSSANLTGANLHGAILSDADLGEAVVTNVDFSGAIITGADFRDTWRRGFTIDQLRSTASYSSGDLRGLGMRYNDLRGVDFAGMNLTEVDFGRVNLDGADFNSTIITRADFGGASTGAEQFYSTANYQRGDLRGIVLTLNDLRGWNFAGKDLEGANLGLFTTLEGADFRGANLANVRFDNFVFDPNPLKDADLRRADLRGADVVQRLIEAAASTDGAILPDGRIEGLSLAAGERLVVRDYDVPDTPWTTPEPNPITVECCMNLDSGATLRMVLGDDEWGSTISFEPGIDVALGGTLELMFEEGVVPGDRVGTTFDLFDWDGAVVNGQFDRIVAAPGTVWDTSELYTTGRVTLVPEPPTFVLLLWVALAAMARRRRKAGSPNQQMELHELGGQWH